MIRIIVISLFTLAVPSFAVPLPQASITDDYAQEYFGKQACGGESLCKNKKENFDTPHLGCHCPDIGQHYCYLPVDEDNCTEGCGLLNSPCIFDCGNFQYEVSPCQVDVFTLTCECQDYYPDCTLIQECAPMACNGHCRYEKNPATAHEIACANMPPTFSFFCQPE